MKIACFAFAGAMVAAVPAMLVGCGDSAVDLSKEVNKDISYMTEHVYNKLDTDWTFASMSKENKENFYTLVGDVKAEDKGFKIGNKAYDGEEYKLSVGLDKNVNAPRYYVEENKLYVASYFLSLKSDSEGRMKCSYGNTNFDLIISTNAKADVKAGNASKISTNEITAVANKANEYDVTVNDSRALFKLDFTSNNKVVKPKLFITEQVNNYAATESSEARSTIKYGFTAEEVKDEGWLGFYAVGYGSNKNDSYSRDYTIMPVGYKAITIKLNITQVAQA